MATAEHKWPDKNATKPDIETARILNAINKPTQYMVKALKDIASRKNGLDISEYHSKTIWELVRRGLVYVESTDLIKATKVGSEFVRWAGWKLRKCRVCSTEFVCKTGGHDEAGRKASGRPLLYCGQRCKAAAAFARAIAKMEPPAVDGGDQ